MRELVEELKHEENNQNSDRVQCQTFESLNTVRTMCQPQEWNDIATHNARTGEEMTQEFNHSHIWESQSGFRIKLSFSITQKNVKE